MPYTEMETTELKLFLIAEHAKRNAAMPFTSLAHLLNTRFLRKCFMSLNRNKAVGQERRPNTFDFLGFSHYCDRTRQGRFQLGRKTSRKKYAAKCRDLNEWLKENRNRTKIKEWWKILSAKLRRHYQYYGVSGNYRAISGYYSLTLNLVRKWLNRRSQKRSMSWAKFYDYLSHYPLPKSSIRHHFYTGYPCTVK